jgi:hypothetical protein
MTTAMTATTQTRSAGKPRGLERLVLLLFVSVWVILQNNARISDNVPTDAGWSLLSIPRAARVVEAVMLFALFALHHSRLTRVRLGDFVALVWMFILTALVSVALTPTSPVSQFQGVYVYAAPFLLFGWAAAVGPTPRLITRLIAILSIYLALSVAVALFIQLPVLRTRSDYIHGLFSDAHALGAYLAICSCVAFSRFMAVGGVLRLLLAVALLLVSYFPSNEKMIAFNVMWFAGAVAWRLMRHPASRRGLTMAAAAFALASWVAAARTGDIVEWYTVNHGSERRVLEQGPVQAWVRTADVILGSPSDVLVGVGPGNYAGIAAASAINDDATRARALSEGGLAALRDTTSEEAGALGLQSNTWSNLLAEFGIIGFLLFTLTLFQLSWPMLRWHPRNQRDAFARLVCLSGLGAVLWQGFITPYTNWAEPVLVYPVMAVAAYCHNAACADAAAQSHARASRRIAGARDGASLAPLTT